MKTLFGKLLISFILIIILIISAGLASFYFVYTASFERQIVADNDRQAMFVARYLSQIIALAYKEIENLAYNNDIISMETDRQTPIFIDSLRRNDYFELIYAQGMDGMQTGRSSGTLGDRKERWWFKQMEEVKKPFVSESYISVGTNMPCTSIFYPIEKDSEMIGIMAGDIKLSALTELVLDVSNEGSWSFILDGKGVVVAHPDAVYLEEMYNFSKLTRTVARTDAAGNALLDSAGNVITEEQPMTISDAYKAAIADMMNGNAGNAKFIEDRRMILISYRPVEMFGVSDPWFVISVTDEDAAMESRNTVIMVMLASYAVIIVISMMIVFFVARTMTSPIKIVHQALHKLMKKDLTSRVTVKTRDEIGEMMHLLNNTQEELRTLIVEIKGKASDLMNVGNDLAVNMHNTTEAINLITENLYSIRGKAKNQSESVVQTKAAIEQVVLNIGKLRKNVEDQTESVSQSSSAVEEMLANIQGVTETLIRNAQSVDELIKVSDEGRSSLQKVSQDIKEIARESEGLLAINAVMENIASQTNLLSMNAAIEAAHAGETGKGFAVVAGEIRKLAISSSDQSKTISDVLKRIKNAIDTITASTRNVMEKFHSIEERVRTVSQQETVIRNAMEEQGNGSQRILEAIAKLNDLTGMVRHSSQQMLDGSSEIINESINLEKATMEIENSMGEMTNSANQINDAVGHVSDISKSNKEYISSLFDEVSKFKIE